MIIFRIFFVLIFIFAMSQNSYAQDNENNSNEKIIHNEKPLYKNADGISLEFVHKIGGLDETDEDYLLFNPLDVALDAQGNIYVLDAGNYRVQKYDPSGYFLTTFGKQGQGPIEYINPVSLDVDVNTNEVYVADVDLRRISIVSNEGEEIRNFRLNGKVKPFKFLPNGLIYAGIMTEFKFSEDQLIVQPVIQIFNKEGVLLNEFGSAYDYQDVLVNTMGNVVYFISDRNSNIYVVFRHQNRIEKYTSTGELLFSATRRLNYELTYPKTTITRNAEGGAQGFSINPSFSYVSRGIGLDAQERIWVLTVKKQSKSIRTRVRIPLKYDDPSEYVKFEIFSNDGILLYEIPFKMEFTPAERFHMFGDRVFFRDSDETAIYEYKVIGD